ncbi:MAG: DUF1080 domain-containing protein [Pirellulaceae bacterium]
MREGDRPQRIARDAVCFLLLCSLCSIVKTVAAQEAQRTPAEATSDWQPMFNGRDLSEWELVNTPAETWSFQDGMLICSGKPIGEIRTKRMYQNFEMEIEWRHMVPGGNAGIFVWADDITARGVPFHRGIEVQVLENAYGNTQNHTTHGDIFPIHGADMTPVNGRGGKRAFPTAERSRPSPEWNHYRIVCENGNISLAVNGEVVTRGKNASPRKGYICLESEGGVVHYRNARIRQLPSPELDPKFVATVDRGYRSLYSGLDLRGWKSVAPSAWQAKDWILAFDGNVSARESGLETEQSLEIQGLVLDFRFLENSESLAVELPGASKPLIFSSTSQTPFTLLLEKPGNWNRVECTVESSVLQMLVNGKPIQVDQQLRTGKLAIRPIGPVELANIYVR